MLARGLHDQSNERTTFFVYQIDQRTIYLSVKPAMLRPFPPNRGHAMRRAVAAHEDLMRTYDNADYQCAPGLERVEPSVGRLVGLPAHQPGANRIGERVVQLPDPGGIDRRTQFPRRGRAFSGFAGIDAPG